MGNVRPMSWIALSLLSAFLLGFYNLLKKHAVDANSTLLVLLFSTTTSALFWLPAIANSFVPIVELPEMVNVSRLSLKTQGFIAVKSVIMIASWMFGYAALKNLPLSIAAPIRATGPLWTIFIATIFLGERPLPLQWMGILVLLGAFYAFSFVGKLESIEFHRNKWVAYTLIATLLASLSGIYDKILLQSLELRPADLQAYFSLFQALIMIPVVALARRRNTQKTPFQWRWSIPLVGLSLLFADFAYFSAVAQDGALISVISPIRRASILITFFGAIYLHKEVNFKPKFACICLLLIGVCIIKVASGS